MKSVVITGTSSVFGFKAAKDFADKGYKVFAAMRNSTTKNIKQRDELTSYSELIKVIELDVTSDESVTLAINQVLTTENKIDILINNAGIMHFGITEAYSIEQAHDLMNTNYYGMIRVTQAVLPNMQKMGKGLIINTSSIAGRLSMPFFATYNASKFAI